MSFINKYKISGEITDNKYTKSVSKEFVEGEFSFIYNIARNASGKCIITKLNTSGNTIWVKEIEQFDIHYVHTIEEVSSNLSEYTAVATFGASPEAFIYLIKFDTNGSILQIKKITTQSHTGQEGRYVQYYNNHFFIVFNKEVLKINNNGDLVQRWEFSNTKYISNNAYSFYVEPITGYMLFFHHVSTDENLAYLVVRDQNFAKVEEIQINYPNAVSRLNPNDAIFRKTDNGFDYFFSMSKEYGAENQEVCLVKTENNQITYNKVIEVTSYNSLLSNLTLVDNYIYYQSLEGIFKFSSNDLTPVWLKRINGFEQVERLIYNEVTKKITCNYSDFSGVYNYNFKAFYLDSELNSCVTAIQSIPSLNTVNLNFTITDDYTETEQNLINSETISNEFVSKELTITEICPSNIFDITQSTITASPNIISTSGIEFSTITVQLKDSKGENITNGGESIIVLTTLGTISSTVDNGDGTYTASLNSTEVGSSLVSFTVNGVVSPNKVNVNFIESQDIDHEYFVKDLKGAYQPFFISNFLYHANYRNQSNVYKNIPVKIIKTDVNYNIYWAKETTNMHFVLNIIGCDNGDVIVYGGEYEEVGDIAKVVLLRLNTDGNVVWLKKYDINTVRYHSDATRRTYIAKLEDGKYIFRGFKEIGTIDENGNLIKTIVVKDTSTDNDVIFYDLTISSGKIFLLTSSLTSGDILGLVSLDKNFNLLTKEVIYFSDYKNTIASIPWIGTYENKLFVIAHGRVRRENRYKKYLVSINADTLKVEQTIGIGYFGPIYSRNTWFLEINDEGLYFIEVDSAKSSSTIYCKLDKELNLLWIKRQDNYDINQETSIICNDFALLNESSTRKIIKVNSNIDPNNCFNPTVTNEEHITETLTSVVKKRDFKNISLLEQSIQEDNPVVVLNNFDISFIDDCIAIIPVDLTKSSIVANPTSILANGTSVSVITVTLKDAGGNIITNSTSNVVIQTDIGNLSTTINNSNGTYTANLTSTVGGTATLSFTVDGEASPNEAEVVLTPVTLELTNSTKLQSTNLYVQAAGSTGNDGSVKGVHLRWLLKGYLGDTHLPKGNNARTTHHFNKPDDFVRIYRAPYEPQYVTLDFENLSPSVVDHSNYLWIYRINEVPFYVYFKNKLQYNRVKGTTNALANSFSFIQNYGNNIIEIDHKTTLSFAITMKAASTSTNIQAEVLSVEDNTLTAPKYVTARKEFVGEGRLEEENIRTLRFKANHIKEIQFELYADALTHNLVEEKWAFVGEYALTTEDTIAENRLEPENNTATIHGEWPRFNDGDTVNKDNYIDRWNGAETQPYNSATEPAYYEYYDRRLKTTVKRYIELSDASANNPVAMEGIPFGTTLPEGVTSQEEDTQDISNLTILQLASMDYHLARMLGLGHIDTSIDTNEEAKKYVYLAEYKTTHNINNGLNDNGAKDIQHIFLSLPTAITDERLPIPVNLQEPVLGIHNSTNENITELVDEEGYLYDGKQRFISLINEELPNNQTNLGFFEERTLFSTAEATTPVYAGIEYKLFDPANPNSSNWRKPELSNTSKYKNYATGDNSSAEFNEAVPILVPEANEVLFLHREREEGWHRYGSYGINWFSRSQQSTVFWDIETSFSPQNRLLPPSNIKACLIVEESPLMLTSAKEQELFEAITTEDKTLVRLTFDHNINQDKITYQINEDSMGTFTDPLHENAIYRDDKEVFADRVNLFFRNKPPKTVTGKIKSIETHANNALAIIRTEDYFLVSTETTITPEVLPNEFTNFVGSVFMFNDTKYIVHEVTASTVADEGPIFTVYKELVSEAMLNGTEPDPTVPLELPTFSDVTMFNTVENMLTESNWKVGESSAINKLDFQINIGNNWPIHREVIDEESISGVPEQILEKSRGIWETAVIEEARRPEENIYDAEGVLIAEPKHVGMYKITFPNSLDHHAQFNSHNVDWYQGIVRIHTQNNPTKKRKVLEVVKIENVGTSDPLVVYALDPQYPTNVDNASSVPGFDPILTGSQEVNFYPGYRVYLYHDATHHLTEEAILPSRGEGLKYSIVGLQSVDPDYPESATNPNEWYTSKIGQPAQFFAQEVIRPEIPLLSNGEEFVYATRPDTFGKSTFSLTPGFRHIPHGVQFYRSNDDAILNALYKPSTVIEIKEKLKEDIDSKFHLVKRWQNLLGFNFEYEETFQTDNEFFIYPEDETGYRFPKPDKYELYNSINNVLEYRNENYGTTYSLLDLGDRADDTNNGVIGAVNLTDVVIPRLESEGINNDVTFKDYIQSVIHNVFTPLTEIPLMYQYIKGSDYQPIAKKQVIRDASGSLLPPTSNKFDMAPMAKRMSTEFINEIPGADTRILFTDFNLDGTSDNLYFYAIREMGSTMQLGDFSPVLGPVKLVNTKPPKSPSVRRILPILQNRVLNINPGVSVEINAYPKVENIKQIKLYRTLEPSKALSVRTMDLVTTINLETDGQLTNNIWKLKDEFTDLGYVPYGDPLYYRVTALREVEYADGSNTVKDGHPQITEYVPSESSKLLISSIVENANPEAPTLEYNFDADSTDATLLNHVILKWDKKVHNGKYHVYKMNAQGNWVNIHSLSSNVEDVQLLLDDTSLGNGTLKVTTETGDVKYHHFKVVSENSTGMMSTEEKILTIPNLNNIDDEEGIGDMIVENTNIVR
ncbi:Ig-like domain-containing protein [Tenacibaculum amylolyticum]|uniref:Ig-like domain-containing protein n=1 Tax=Tenacibaculum amylolyticum TaxID=104269 RepID=UPI00389469EB